MDEQFEIIKQQMEVRRSALTEKLEALETQVTQGVQEVTEAVSTVKEVVHDTVETVRDSVEETVDAVKETFNLSHQMRERPWIMLGGAFALGFLGGQLIPKSPAPRPTMARRLRPEAARGVSNAAFPPLSVEPERPSSSWMSSLTGLLGPEISKLKAMGLGMAVGMLRDSLLESAPNEIGSHLKEVFDDITRKLGGEPVQEGFLRSREHSNGRHYSESV